MVFAFIKLAVRLYSDNCLDIFSNAVYTSRKNTRNIALALMNICVE